MEAYYYSSDEEMAWGPRTLREIKGDLKRLPIRKPSRRHTTAFSNIKTQTGTKIKEDSKMGSNPSSKIDSVCDNIDNLNISKTSTTYFTPNHTPNESLHTNPNSNFLEKLSHAIDNPSELSEYASVLSDSGNDKLEGTSEAEDISDKIKVLNIPKILITEADCLGNNDSCINFIRSLENRETCYNIDNFQQTLVENTYALSDDSVEESVIINEQDCEVTENSFSEEQKFTEQAEEEDVIVISDEDSDEDYSFSCTTDVDNDNVIAVKKETTFTECKHKESTSNIIDSKISKQSEVELHEDQFKHDKCNGTGNTSLESNSVSRDSDEKSPETSPLTPNIEHKHFTTQDYLSSPVIVPEIDLTQFDDSISKDTSLHLDDTLEEMNRFLSQGPNYTMSDDEVVDSTPVRTELGADPQTPSDTYITPGTLKSVKQQLFPTDSKKTKSHIPTKNVSQIPTTVKSQKKPVVIKDTPNSNFKVPNFPIRPKVTNLATPKSCSSRLKNVISPVALYIKNSPRIPLTQNVPQRPLHRTPTCTPTRNAKCANKENVQDFPEVVYTPSKKQIVSTEKHIIVPDYLKKLNVKESHITKHEGRIVPNLKEAATVSDQLLQTDITNVAIDQSILDNSGDVSVLTNKQAFIK